MKQIVLGVIVVAASAMLARAEPAKDRYLPGLGEFMTATQLRHAKLWFAGKNLNWGLAAYEVDEIKEGLEDASKLHASFEGIAVADMIKTIIAPRLDKLEKAIAAQSGTQFVSAFDDLTDGCNSCHAAAGKPFIRIQRPTAPPLSNQDFTPPK